MPESSPHAEPTPQPGLPVRVAGPAARISAALILAAGLTTAVAHHLLTAVLPWDDAYITFRYAERLAAGAGMTFNDGERIFGSSTPLYTLWLAAGRLILPGVSLPAFAVRGNLVFFLISALALGAVGASLTSRREGGWALAGAYLLSPWMLTVSTGGMESSLFVALALGAAACGLRHRFIPAAALAGLAVVTRPEGILVAAPLVALWAMRRRPHAVATALLLVAPGAFWIVGATLYFGSPIPQSIIAKLAPLYELPPAYAFLGLVAWMGRWSLPLPVLDPAPARDIAAFLLAQAGAVGLVLDPRARRAGGWLAAVLLEILVFFYGLTNPQLFDWYTAPVFPLWLIALGVGLPALGRVLFRQASRQRAMARAATLAVAIGTALALAGWGTGRIDPAHSNLRLRTLAYRDAALRLNAIAPRGGTLAAAEIGALGYWWHGRILDACGLVSPQTVPFLPVPRAERPDFRTSPIPLGLIQAERPDFIVSLPLFISTTLLRSDWFGRTYLPLGEVPLPRRVWGADSVLIFQRGDLPAPILPADGVSP